MVTKNTILIIEDENNISSFMSTILKANKFHVLRAKNGAEGMMLCTSCCPDVILLDLGLPDMDGNEIIHSIRSWSRIPIIVVSARTNEKDKVRALDGGADDYITKPFGTSELLARIRTALRHANLQDSDEKAALNGKYTSGTLTVDFGRRRVFLDGEGVHMTQNEYKIVESLAKCAGRVLTYDYLLKKIWGPNMNSDNQILRVNMANIRRKLELNPAEPKFIFTEIGVGYRMVEGD
ncbi:MAG: response regulator [Clostridia bacterium]|nr:response regulator [Clostridia bacterium]